MKLTYIILLVALVSVCCADPDAGNSKEQDFQGKGTVLAVDPEKGVLTIDHGEIKGLMSAMTMDFETQGRKVLEGVRGGDKISFKLRKTGDDIKLVSVEIIGKRSPAGAEIYAESCARCHGDKGEGARKGIPLIEGHALDHTEADFLEQVREGGKEMPSFKDELSNDEIEAVVRYVRQEIQKGLRNDDGPKTHKH